MQRELCPARFVIQFDGGEHEMDRQRLKQLPTS
jgi:hypothetical protein